MVKLEPGEQVTPNVRLVRQLGSGGMASVWVARHSGLHTDVAVKFLRGAHAEDEGMRARFAREAMAATRVKSAHVVKVHDAGLTDDGTPYLVMELLEGHDLGRKLAEGPLDRAQAVAITNQLCKALERAHEAGIVHRDVKPENVFLCEEGGELFVKLLDFGIAKSETLLHESARRSTAVTELLGTPYYMSPEQMRSAKQIDHRSDLFSVGVVVYEMLTGVLPFQADSLGALAIAIDECQPTPASTIEPSLPPAFDAWFAIACARDPADRFASARELADALKKALAGEAPPRAVAAPASHGTRSSRAARAARDVATLDDGFAETETAPSVSAHRTSPVPAKRPWVGVAVGVVAAVLAIGAIARVTREDPERTPPATSAAPTEPATTTSTTPPPPVTTASTASTTPPPIATTSSVTALRPSAASTIAPPPHASVSAAASTPPAPTASATATPSATASSKHPEDIW